MFPLFTVKFVLVNSYSEFRKDMLPRMHTSSPQDLPPHQTFHRELLDLTSFLL
jgi:hypothetical protein